KAWGPIPIKGLAEPVEVWELLGVSGRRRRLQTARALGLTRFVGRQTELTMLKAALAQAGAGHGQVVAVMGEAGGGQARRGEGLGQGADRPGGGVVGHAGGSLGQRAP